MATTPKDLNQFVQLRRELVKKHGEALLSGTPEQVQAIREDVEPLAKFARVTPDRIITSLLRDYLEGL